MGKPAQLARNICLITRRKYARCGTIWKKRVATVKAFLTVGFWGFRCKEPMVNSQDELTVGRSRAVNPQFREFGKPVVRSGHAG